ncbi:tetrapyrrole methylase [Schizothecium vesticola]|uniref:Tetrapyrrole methylase n=1 Tax=Schizothecium vesticola TaxID=314040 RepID=A0AA40F1Q3_9PEZI|nr:tetrapyrrole methylase [Schizothecium vesticola]
MASSSPTTLPPPPAYHTSLLAAHNCRGHIHLILGSNPLAASRATQSLAAGAKPIIITSVPAADLHHAVAAHIASGAVTHLARAYEENDLSTLGRQEVDHVVDAVFVTSSRDPIAPTVSATCKRLRIPINVVDAPALCSFSLLSVHVDGPLQIGVTTNGRGCKLASRIRREVAAALPDGLGSACATLGDVRRRIMQEDGKAKLHPSAKGAEDEGVDDSVDQTAAFNKLVTEADADAAKTRRIRWLSQICEYWPLKRLSAITDADVAAILKSYPTSTSPDLPSGATPQPRPTTGRIILAGSGPGHPDLLTQATHKAIQRADLILADKLVPAGVLDLIPRRTPVRIARKFPGNADRAQEELLQQALDGVRAGQTVLRLKQGDPFIYGRGGEEVAFFRAHGLGDRVVVLPGITSSLSAPLFAGIPATQRDVADQVLVCTGTGKKGKPPVPPEFVASRTVVFLMALHRIGGLVGELTTRVEEDGVWESDKPREGETTGRRRALWPLDTPCAVVERASCPDQRVIRTTLRFVAEAIEQEGSRPPGLLVVGRACEALFTPAEGKTWAVEDGFKGLDLDLGVELELGNGEGEGVVSEGGKDVAVTSS